MQLSKATRITLIVTAGAVVLGLATLAWLSGATIDLKEILTALGGGLAGLLAGLASAGGPSSPTTPPKPPRAVLSALTIFLLTLGMLWLPGCGAARCQVERTIVASVSGGIEAAAVSVEGDEPDGWDEAMRYARGAVELGEAGVRACELARDGAGWQAWVALALGAAGDVVEALTREPEPEPEPGLGLLAIEPAASPSREVPQELLEAIELLEAERQRE